MMMMSGSHIAGRLLMFVFTVILARELGDAAFGQFSWVFSYVAFAFIVADMGISILTVRELAKDSGLTKDYLQTGLFLKTLLGAAGALLMVSIVQFLDQSPEVKRLVYWLTIYMLGDSYMRFFFAIFRAHEKMEFEALINIFIRVIIAAFGILVLFSDFKDDTLFMIILVYVSAHLLGTLFLFETLRTQFSPIRFSFNLPLVKTIFTHAWPFALSTFFTGIYYNLDTIMLGVMRTDEEVGWYNAAYRILLFLLLFLTTFQTVVFPIFSRLFHESREELARLMRLCTRVLILLSVPIAIGGFFIGKDLLVLIYGEEYINGTFAFQILLTTLVVVSISIIYGTALQAGGKQRLQLLATAAGAGVNVVLNIFVIPRYGLSGAAMTTLASELAVLAFLTIYSRKIIHHPFLPHIWRPLLAGAGMAAALWFLPPLHVLIQISVGALVYAVAIFVFRGLTIEELQRLRALFKKS